jgi:hypothetical protein
MRGERNLANEWGRFLVRSSFEAPLTVDAPDWKHALGLALQLTEREEVAAHLALRRRDDGSVVASDPRTGEVFFVERVTMHWERRVAVAA